MKVEVRTYRKTRRWHYDFRANGEREVLLSPGMEFRVAKPMEEKRGEFHFYLEEI